MPSVEVRILEHETARADLAIQSNQQLRKELSRALHMLSGQHVVKRRAARTERELGRAQALLAEQSSTVHQGHQTMTEVHADAVELARLVALNFRAQRWAGYEGEVRDVVERYIQTGH